MTLFIILIILLIISIYLTKSYKYEMIGTVFSVLLVPCLLLHFLSWISCSYKYHEIVEERKAITETIISSRKTNFQLENATITLRIIDFNVELYKMKYNNTLFLLDSYIDDRIDSVKPIKQ